MTPIMLLVLGIAGAILFEAITIHFRFARKMTSPEKTAWLGRVTRGWRVHHGYHGFAMIPAGMLFLPGMIGDWLVVAGLALLLSDAIHHFIVLKLTTGHHEFWLKYPPQPVAATVAVETQQELKKAA